jgi:hypothetical protein
MADTFIYKFGDYTYEAGSVVDFQWTFRSHQTVRAHRDIAVYRVELKGMFVSEGATPAQSWADIRDRIALFRDAHRMLVAGVSLDKKFSVSHPNGTETSYVLDPDNPWTIKGPYVIDLEYPTGTIEELLAKREWTVTLECLVLEPESEIIRYDEQVQHVGTCGPSAVTQYVFGEPRRYMAWPWTTQTIIQRGSSVGLGGYYLPGWLNVPFPNSLTPFGIRVLGDDFEHVDKREHMPGKPLRLGNKFLYYPAAWKYVFESKVPLLMLPQ